MRNEVIDSDPKLLSRVMGALRRVWLWSEVRRAVYRESRECAICGRRFGVGEKKNIDHVNPVAIPYPDNPEHNFILPRINRLFCKRDNLQALCIKCHDMKTLEERTTRKAYKKHVNASNQSRDRKENAGPRKRSYKRRSKRTEKRRA